MTGFGADLKNKKGWDNMKKAVVYILCLILCLGALNSCKGQDDGGNPGITVTPEANGNDSGTAGTFPDTPADGAVTPTVTPDAGAVTEVPKPTEEILPTENPEGGENGNGQTTGDNDADVPSENGNTDTSGESYGGFYTYGVGTDRQDIHAEDAEEKIVAHVSIPTVVYYGPSEQIKKGIDEMNAYFRETGTRQYGLLKEIVSYLDEDSVNQAEEYNYLCESSLYGVRSDNVVFSGIISEATYTGGVHPDYGYETVNISGISGKELSLSEVFKDREKLAEELVRKLSEKYPDTKFFNLEEDIKKEVEEERISFLVGYSGISFFFSPYELASFADGILDVSFSFEEYGDIIEDNIKKTPQVMNIRLIPEVPYYLDADGDGTEDCLRLTLNVRTEEYSAGDFTYHVDYADQLTITVNGKKVLDHRFPEYSYDATFYLMQNEEGEKYFYIRNACDSEDYFIEGFRCTKGKFVNIGTVAENLQGCTEECEGWAGSDLRTIYMDYIFNPYSIPVVTTTDIVGSIQVRTDSYIDSDGGFEPRTPISEFINDRFLTTKEEILCAKADENGTLLEENLLLPAGTELQPVRTIGKEGVLFADMSSENYYYMEFTFKEYRYYVNDKPIEEVFDGVYYYG